MTAQTYTVTYHRNGADSGETVDSRSYIFGDLAVVSENGYVRDGHSFVGWNTQRDGSGTHHVPGSSITVTDHIHLYAQWTRNSSGDDDDTGYTLRLTKLDAGDGTPLSGAKFELWRVGTRSDTRLGVYETNRYGWTQAEVSQSGDYYWVETVPPEGYDWAGASTRQYQAKTAGSLSTIPRPQCLRCSPMTTMPISSVGQTVQSVPMTA